MQGAAIAATNDANRIIGRKKDGEYRKLEVFIYGDDDYIGNVP